MSKCEQIFLDAEGNKTSKEKAVEVITRTYNDEGELISRTIESVKQADTSFFQGNYGDELQTVVQPSVGGHTPTDSFSWICPNDETVNTGEICVICGMPRNEISNCQADNNTTVSEYPGNAQSEKGTIPVPKEKNSKLLWGGAIAACILLLLIISKMTPIASKSEQEMASSTLSTVNNTEPISVSAETLPTVPTTISFQNNLRKIAAGDWFVVGITNNGDCIASGDYPPEVTSWHNMVQIAADGHNIVGLTSSGQVLCTIPYPIESWSDIVMVDYNCDIEGNEHVIALKSDGTVEACGTNMYDECDVASWSSIVKVVAGARHSVGLRENGTVIAVGYGDDGQLDVSEWSDIVDIAAARTATYGLKNDGTILVAGHYEDQYVNRVDPVPQWDNVVAIIAGNEGGMDHDYVIGICKDGTIVSNRYGYTSAADIASFSNVSSIASASWGYTVAICSDGTVHEIGWDADGSRNASVWTQMSVR